MKGIKGSRTKKGTSQESSDDSGKLEKTTINNFSFIMRASFVIFQVTTGLCVFGHGIAELGGTLADH